MFRQKRSLFFFFATILVCSVCKGQTIQLYAEDFETSPTFILNGSGYVGTSSGVNQWVINNSYNGLGTYPDTYSQDSTFSGTIDNAPFSHYLHITNSASAATNANFDPAMQSDNFTVMASSECTGGLINVTLTFFYICQGSSTEYAEVYYSKNNGPWIQTGLLQYNNAYKWKNVAITNPDFSDAYNLRFGIRWVNDAGTSLTPVGFGIDDVRLFGTYDPIGAPVTIHVDSLSNDSVCQNSSLVFYYTYSDSLCPGNYQIQMSDASGSFASPTILAIYSLYFPVPPFSYSLPATIPVNTPLGNCYKIRLNRITAPLITSQPSQCFTIYNCPTTITTLQPAVTLDTNAVCVGSVIDVPFYSSGTFINNLYTAELSGPTGIFPSTPPYHIIGTFPSDYAYSSQPGNIGGRIPNLPDGCNYYIRVKANDPVTIGTISGPFCIQHCDIVTNNNQDLHFCLTPTTSSIDTLIPVNINSWNTNQTFLPGNKFSLELRSTGYPSVPWNFVNSDSLGWVSAVNDTTIHLVVPPLLQLVTMGISPGAYYMRVVASNASFSDSALGTIVRLTIGAPADIAPTVTTYITTPTLIPADTICIGESMDFILNWPAPNWTSNYIWHSTQLPSDAVVPGNQGGGLGINFGGFTGSFNVSVREENSGCLATNSTPVTVFVAGPPGFTSGPSALSICAGAPAVFSVVDTGTVLAYQWKKGSTNLADGGSIFGANTSTMTIHPVSASDAGTYSVDVIGPCGSYTHTCTLAVYSAPNVSVSVFNDTLSANASGAGITYQWISCPNGPAVSGATHKTFVPTTPGTYAVVITKGCSDTSACLTTGIETPGYEGERGIILSPNPSDGKFTVYALHFQSYQVEVYNVMGERVFQSDQVSAKQFIVDLSDKPSGIYFVSLKSKEETITRRLVKME